MRIKDKRGMTLNDIYPAVLTLVLIGIILGIGIFVMSQVGLQLSTTSGTVINESGLGINRTVITVDQASEPGFNTFAITSCFANATSQGTLGEANTSIASGNWTTNSEGGTITNATSLEYNDVKCSYTYLYGTDASTAIDTSMNATAGFADWIAVIVVVIAAAIVLGIVLKSFGRGTPGV